MISGLHTPYVDAVQDKLAGIRGACSRGSFNSKAKALLLAKGIAATPCVVQPHHVLWLCATQPYKCLCFRASKDSGLQCRCGPQLHNDDPANQGPSIPERNELWVQVPKLQEVHRPSITISPCVDSLGTHRFNTSALILLLQIALSRLIYVYTLGPKVDITSIPGALGLWC